MAQLFPPTEVIRELSKSSTAGELCLLSALQEHLDDSFEIYFQPFLNGDNPDIIVMRRLFGVLIVEVKDWQLVNYRLGPKRQWKLVKNGATVKSPSAQVIDYKRNLYDLHIESLLERKIASPDLFDLVGGLVYFANENTATAREFFGSAAFTENGHLREFGNFQVAGRDEATRAGIEKWVGRCGMLEPDERFDDALYNNFRRYLQPPFHPHQDGEPINYPREQGKLIESGPSQQKIRGVAGSGKTMILARRAVNAHKRTGSRVLILTYNITLRNYIHDKISKVREDFDWGNFFISHYHGFFKAMANNLGLPFKCLEDFNRADFFESAVGETPRFDAIFVDEVQDYRIDWLRSVRRYFLKKDGEFVLFGDEKQNIYRRDLEVDRRIRTNIPGKWNDLTSSFRLSDRIIRVATAYQEHFFQHRYDLDSIKMAPEQRSLFDDQQHFAYFDLSNALDGAGAVFELYCSASERFGIHPNDVCIVSSKTTMLREIDYRIRTLRRERTMTMFVGQELYGELRLSTSSNEELEEIVKALDNAKKLHFWMNPGIVKLATIHSFKGWEINTLFLLLNPDESRIHPKHGQDGRESVADEELVYTAITRCRCNLFVINLGDRKYHEFFSRVASAEGEKGRRT